MTKQLILPFPIDPRLTRDAFLVAPGNAQAAEFIDSWPAWPCTAAALFGPAGSGKTHLVSVWLRATGGSGLDASELHGLPLDALDGRGPVAVENVDSAPASLERDRILFRLIDGVSSAAPVLLTGRGHPAGWAVALPDLASRFAALLAFPLWRPDDGLLGRLAQKLFADRQLTVPEPVIHKIIHSLERSPDAIRAFVERADAKALAEGRGVTLGLVRELLAAEEAPPSF